MSNKDKTDNESVASIDNAATADTKLIQLMRHLDL